MNRLLIAVDKNQLAKGTHFNSNLPKHRYLVSHNCDLLATSLPVGDYCVVTGEMEVVFKRAKDRNVAVKKIDLVGKYPFVVDTKKDLIEVVGNVCNTKNHGRVKDDLIRAKEHGTKVIWLIENEEGVRSINDMFRMGNELVVEHYYRPLLGEQIRTIKRKSKVKYSTLAKALTSMKANPEYDIDFVFCSHEKAGETLKSLLEKGGK